MVIQAKGAIFIDTLLAPPSTAVNLSNEPACAEDIQPSIAPAERERQFEMHD